MMNDPTLNFLAFIFIIAFVGLAFVFVCLILDEEIYRALKKKLLNWLK